jgi:DNA helicase INO80
VSAYVYVHVLFLRNIALSDIAYMYASHLSPSPSLSHAPTQWQQEFKTFAPALKVLPYWGTQSERKIIRKFWGDKNLYTKESPFHVLITR